MSLTVRPLIHLVRDNSKSIMTIQLLKGHFTAAEASELITQLIHVKIKFHESKIENSDSEEDMKYRESRIKELQRDLYEFKKQIAQKHSELELHAQLQVSPASVVA